MKWWSHHWELSPLDSNQIVSEDQMWMRKRHISQNPKVKKGFDFAISLQYTNRLREYLSCKQIQFSSALKSPVKFFVRKVWSLTVVYLCHTRNAGATLSSGHGTLFRHSSTLEISSLMFCHQDATAEDKTLHVCILHYFWDLGHIITVNVFQVTDEIRQWKRVVF